MPKISFVKRFAAWDWYLISGVYVNDIDAAFRADLLRYLLTILVIGSFSTLALVLIIRNVKRSLGGEPAYAASVAETIADGDLSCPVTLAGDDRESMSPTDALAAMRFHHQLLPQKTIYFEPYRPAPDELATQLKAFGYAVEQQSFNGDVQMILVDGTTPEPASDPRGGGVARVIR